MADRSFSGIGQWPLKRRGRSNPSGGQADTADWSANRPTFPALSFLLLSLSGGLIVGCGSTTDPGSEVVAPTTTIATTTTTTIPPETTTTIDFNRPVDQQTTPLPEEALIAELAEVVNDMRGQTEDVYQQMVRLIDFPKLSSPIGSQILDFSAVMKPGEARGELLTESSVTLRVPNDSTDLAKYFAAELDSRSWNESDLTRETTEMGTRTTSLYRVPGISGDEKELTVVVETMPGLVLVTIEHHSIIDDDDESFELLQGWQEKIRTPSSAEVTTVRISTADNVGTAVVTYELDAETTAEARTDMLDAVRTSEFETTAEANEADGSPVVLADVETGEEFRLEFSDTNKEEIIGVNVIATFPLTPLD